MNRMCLGTEEEEEGHEKNMWLLKKRFVDGLSGGERDKLNECLMEIELSEDTAGLGHQREYERDECLQWMT